MLECSGQSERRAISLNTVINFKEMLHCEITEKHQQEQHSWMRRRLQGMAVRKQGPSQQACLYPLCQRKA